MVSCFSHSCSAGWLGFMQAAAQAVVLQSEGRMKAEELDGLAELAAAGCKAAGTLIRGALFDNTKRLALARGPVAF